MPRWGYTYFFVEVPRLGRSIPSPPPPKKDNFDILSLSCPMNNPMSYRDEYCRSNTVELPNIEVRSSVVEFRHSEVFDP